MNSLATFIFIELEIINSIIESYKRLMQARIAYMENHVNSFLHQAGSSERQVLAETIGEYFFSIVQLFFITII